VAQLGARFHGMEEVVGSIPTRSTIFTRLESIASRAFARILQKTRTNRPDVVPKVVAYHAADPFAKRIHPTKTLHLSVSCRLCWCLSRMALPVPQSVKRMTYAKRPSLARAVLFAGKIRRCRRIGRAAARRFPLKRVTVRVGNRRGRITGGE
jgi:hypothetical protein